MTEWVVVERAGSSSNIIYDILSRKTGDDLLTGSYLLRTGDYGPMGNMEVYSSNVILYHKNFSITLL